jgi:hypothetical protein
MKRMETEPSFIEFKPSKLFVLIKRPRFVEGFPFEFEPRSRLVQKMGSYVERSKNPTT